jgi:hypothetical protein
MAAAIWSAIKLFDRRRGHVIAQGFLVEPTLERRADTSALAARDCIASFNRRRAKVKSSGASPAAC